MIAPWIISHMPGHRVYTEAFGGAASVLLRKPRVYSEIYNDLDGEVVNLFRVLRNPTQGRELMRIVHLTPYAREEFQLSYIADGDPVEQARRTLFRSAAGFATGGAGKYGTGFRTNSEKTGTVPASSWANIPSVIETITERLRGVIIENDQAATVLRRFDSTKTLHYVDPPYVFSTRNKRNAGHVYKHEMTDEQHTELARTLHGLKGYVMLSGYQSDLYTELYGDWHRIDRETHADGGLDRTECLWINRTEKGLF